MLTNTTIEARRAKALSSGVSLVTGIYANRARNAEIWDVENNRYIDFTSGIAVVNTGHCHPRILDATKQQLAKFSHTCHQVVLYDSYVELAERLNALVPGNFDKKTMFVTTGAEAVENAVKIARAATKRTAVVAFNGAFHGRTFLGMSLTGKVIPYKQNFGALVNNVYHVPFPIDLHGITQQQSLDALHTLFTTDVDPTQVAAIIIEPVQGEGGFYPAPSVFLRRLREICDKHGIVFIADEVQTGFARTGAWFAMEHYDVSADITTMAKGLAGGFPLAAVTGRSDIMDRLTTGSLGGTFGGNPVGIAASHAVLDIIEQEHLCMRAVTLGDTLKQRLHSVAAQVPHIADIRGLGCMNAVEFCHPGSTKPYSSFANAVRERALHKGLILLTCGVYSNVIRFLPPLTIEEDIFHEALDILANAIEWASQTHSS